MNQLLTIGDIAAPVPRSISIGPFGSALRADRYEASGVPVVRGQNIGEGWGLKTDDQVFVARETADEFPACIVRPGDLVFPHRGAIGRVARVADQEWLLSSSMMKLTVDPEQADSRFVLLYFRGRGRDELLARASTVGTPGIGQPLTSLRSIPILLPPLREQQAIADVLGALEDKIAANTALATTAEELAVAEVATISDTVPLERIARLTKEQIDPLTLGDAHVHHYSLPAFDVDKRPILESAHHIKSAKFNVSRPAILLSKLNPRIRRVWRATPAQDHHSLASTEFLVLEPIATSPGVLWASISQLGVAMSLESRVSGTSGSHQRVRPADVLSTPVIDVRLAPDRLKLTVETALQLADLARAENATLAATRDALLPQLMSGRLCVRDAETVASTVGA